MAVMQQQSYWRLGLELLELGTLGFGASMISIADRKDG
jgi:hypothetical protein